MTTIPPQRPAEPTAKPPCKHPRVQIVAREEDAEFVACQDCGEVFDSTEFKDMTIEETKLRDDADTDA